MCCTLGPIFSHIYGHLTRVSALGETEMYEIENSVSERDQNRYKVLIDVTGLRQLDQTVRILSQREAVGVMGRRDSFLENVGLQRLVKFLHATLLIL